MAKTETSGYSLSRHWFDFAFENPDLVSTNETALYCWLIELNNRLGWSKKFNITSKECMAACGFNTYRPYKIALSRLIEWGFVALIKQSKNQYQANIISLEINKSAISKNAKAIDKALQKQSTTQGQSNVKSKGNIHLNTETLNTERSVVVKIFAEPTEQEVINYFLENGFSDSAAKRAFGYYHDLGWKDKNGKPVENWKSKMRNVWFKEEDKIKPKTAFHPSLNLNPGFKP